MTDNYRPPPGSAVLLINLGGDLQQSILFTLTVNTLLDALHESADTIASSYRQGLHIVQHATTDSCDLCRAKDPNRV